ncbi:hypothetical protein BJ165DRAFT_1521604 [Panaeolus papilionaceus]|nr:hypothetical protein BJ165DRAFT_1521604 [Panaeolus papilionaceus]
MKFSESQLRLGPGGCPLPVELLVRIFNELQSSNPKAYKKRLQNCRQVCKQFEQIILSLLFKNGVDLGYRPQEPPCSNINREVVLGSLKRYPHLAQHIRDVFLRSPEPNPPKAQAELYRLNHQATKSPLEAWAEGSPLFQLPNICTFTVDTRFFYKALQYDGPGPLSTGLRTLLKHYPHAGTLTTLSLSWVDDIPTPDIFTSPTLVSVEFADCTFSQYVSLSRDASASSLVSICVRHTTAPAFPLPDLVYLPKLERFELVWTPDSPNDLPNSSSFNVETVTTPTISHSFQHLSEIATPNLNDWSLFCQTDQDHINYAPPFPALRKLSLNVAMGKQALANVPILAHIKSLKELTLNHIGMLSDDYYGSDLHLSDHLRQFRKTLELLTLDWTKAFEYNPENFGYPLNQINTALESIANENVLETLNLMMKLQIFCAREPFAPDTTHLATLCRILCSPGAFPCLRNVSLHAEVFVHEDIFKGDDETYEMIEAVMESAISRLRSSETIVFDFTATFDTDSCSSVCYYDSEGDD